MPCVEGFTPVRARAYLAALSVWAAGFLVVIIGFGGQEQVRTISQGLQLVAMFAACLVIFGVAVLVSREVDRWPLWGSGLGWPDLTPLVVMFTLRCWGFLLWRGRPSGDTHAAIVTPSGTRLGLEGAARQGCSGSLGRAPRDARQAPTPPQATAADPMRGTPRGSSPRGVDTGGVGLVAAVFRRGASTLVPVPGGAG